MILVKPSFEILHIDEYPLERIELAGRTCYKSEDKITSTSAIAFATKLIQSGHLSVIEHVGASVKFVIDRGVSHELVRHRLCAFSQESTRYCNYKDQVTFVIPPWCSFEPGTYNKPMYSTLQQPNTSPDVRWLNSVLRSEIAYQGLLEQRWTPQQARSVLPNSLKTEIIVTANVREWRHIFSQRAAKGAHPQMREIMEPLLVEFQKAIPVLFNEI